jgi:hypothetical protein
VRTLVSLPYETQGFRSLVKYLQDKGRAGVVDLPPPPPGAGGVGADQPGAAAGGLARTLYLIPAAQEACAKLGLAWDGRAPLFLAAVVQKQA